MAFGSAVAASAKVVLGVDDRQLTTGLQHAERKTYEAAGSMERSLGKVERGVLAGSGAFQHLGRSIAFASGAFLGAAGFTQVVKDSIGAANELGDQIDRSRAVFGASAKAAIEWSRGTAAGIGVARDEALKAAGTFGTMQKAVGLVGPEAERTSTRLVDLAGNLAALHHVPIDEVFHALEAGLRGRGQQLTEFGIKLSQTALAEEAYRQGIVKSTVDQGKVAAASTQAAIAQAKLADARAKYGAGTTQVASAELALQRAQGASEKAAAGTTAKLTDQQKTLAALAVIFRQTGDQAGYLAKHQDDLDFQTHKLHAELRGAEATIGQALLPTVTNLVTKLADWIDKAQRTGELQRDVNAAMKIGKDVIAGVSAVVKPLAHDLNEVANAFGGWKRTSEFILSGLLAFKIAKLAGEVKALRLATAAPLPVQIAVSVVGSALALKFVGKLLGDQTGFGASAGGTQGGPGGPPVTFVGKQGSPAYYYFVDPATGQIYVSPKQHPSSQEISPVDIPSAVPQGIRAKAAQITAPQVPPVTKAPQVTPSGGATPIQKSIVATAQTALGVPYQYGGLPSLTTPTDCSGLVVAVMSKNGISVPRTAEEQYQQAPIKNPKVLLPGDLVFYDSPHIGHVGIYVGNGTMIVDPHTGDHVKYESITGPGPVVATARWWDTAKAISGSPSTQGPTVAAAGAGGAAGGGLVVGTAAKTPRAPTVPPVAPVIPTSLANALLFAEIAKDQDAQLRILERERAALEDERKHPKKGQQLGDILSALQGVDDQIAQWHRDRADALKKERQKEAAVAKKARDELAAAGDRAVREYFADQKKQADLTKSVVVNAVKQMWIQGREAVKRAGEEDARAAREETQAWLRAHRGPLVPGASAAAAAVERGAGIPIPQPGFDTKPPTIDAQGHIVPGPVSTDEKGNIIPQPAAKLTPEWGTFKQKTLPVLGKVLIPIALIPLINLWEQRLKNLRLKLRAALQRLASLQRDLRKAQSSFLPDKVLEGHISGKITIAKQLIARLRAAIQTCIDELKQLGQTASSAVQEAAQEAETAAEQAAQDAAQAAQEAAGADTAATGDTGGGGGGGGSGAGGVSGDSASVAAQAAADAKAREQEIQQRTIRNIESFLTGVIQLRGFQSNLLTEPRRSPFGGAHITINQYNQGPPEDPHTYSKALEFELRALAA